MYHPGTKFSIAGFAGTLKLYIVGTPCYFIQPGSLNFSRPLFQIGAVRGRPLSIRPAMKLPEPGFMHMTTRLTCGSAKHDNIDNIVSTVKPILTILSLTILTRL